MPSKIPHLLQPEKINIVNTAIVKWNIDSPFEFLPENVNGYEFNFDFNLGFNLEDKLVKADFKIDVATKSEGKNIEEARGMFHFVYVFHIENLEELATADKMDQIVLSGDLGNSLASITYSTTRGILIARLNGTSLEKFILPVIDPNQLLNQQLQKRPGNILKATS